MDNASFNSNLGTRVVTLEQAASLTGVGQAALLQLRLGGGSSGSVQQGRFTISPDSADPDRWLLTEVSR